MEQIRKIIVRMIWGMLLLPPATVYTQVPVHISCSGSVSTMHADFYAEAIKRLRYGTGHDWFLIDVDTRGYSYAVPVRISTPEDHLPDTPLAASSDEKLHLLGLRWKTAGEQDGFVNVLLIGKFLDTVRNRKWVLIEMFAPVHDDSSVGDWETLHHHPGNQDIPETNSLRIFDHKPTNADIYQFLDDWAPYDGGFFTSEDDPLIFLEGEICEETWTNMVGEPPTRFFPEGEDE